MNLHSGLKFSFYLTVANIETQSDDVLWSKSYIVSKGSSSSYIKGGLDYMTVDNTSYFMGLDREPMIAGPKSHQYALMDPSRQTLMKYMLCARKAAQVPSR